MTDRDAERLRMLVDAATEHAIIGCDLDGTVTLFNVGAERMLGYAAGDVVGRLGLTAFHSADEVAARARDLGVPPGVDVLTRAARVGRAETLDWTYVRADGSQLQVALTVTPLRTPDGRPDGFLGVAVDVTERCRTERALRQAADRLAHQALHDPLTGLPNRQLMLDRLTHALAQMGRRGRPLGLIFVDLDRFKDVNDRQGHAAGDQLLVTVAERLRSSSRTSDTVARLGGDEFVVLCEDLHDPGHLDRVARRVGATLERPVSMPQGDVVPSASLGLAVATGGAESPDELLARADAAMYDAKQRRRT